MSDNSTGERLAEKQLIDAIRSTITTARERGDSASGILGQVESLLAGVEVLREHIDRVERCEVCGRQIEHIAGIPDPYWRHVGDASPTAPPHAARPAEVVGDVDDVAPRSIEDGTGVAKPAHVEGYGHRRGAAWATEPSGERPVVAPRGAGA
jgi:hypothetical protein